MTRLPANKWVTVGSCFGPTQRTLYVMVDADVTCKWRKRGLGLFNTSTGTFSRRDSFRVFNQTVQIKSPVDTAYASKLDHAPDPMPLPR
jgi:hypothetical protein